MTFNVISIMGQIVAESLNQGVVGRSFNDGKNTLNIINPRQFTGDVHQTVDDRPFGGGDGMLMLAEPLAKSIDSIPAEARGPLYYLSPQGKLWTDKLAEEHAQFSHMTLISARYGGIDQRVINAYNIEEISIGDYVLSGGELAAAVVIDTIARKMPGVLGHVDSAKADSFADRGLLEGPTFTRPRDWRGQEVPEILLGGHHDYIQKYRAQVAMLTTLQKRPELVSAGGDFDWLALEKFLQDLTDKEC